MRRILKLVLLSVLLITPLTVVSLTAAQRPGDVAPDFALLDANGQVVHLSDFRGTPVVMNAWATWCPFCIEELPLFQAAHDGLNQDTVQVMILLVNLDEPFDTASRFLTEEVGTTVPALFDGTEEMRAAAGEELDTTRKLLTSTYRVRGMPTTFFIDADGVIQMVKIGPILGLGELAGLLAEIGVEWQP